MLGQRMGPLEELAKFMRDQRATIKHFLVLLSSCSGKENDLSIPADDLVTKCAKCSQGVDAQHSHSPARQPQGLSRLGAWANSEDSLT